MGKHHSPETRECVIELARGGFPPRVIIEHVPHLTRNQLTGVLARLRKKGEIPLYNSGNNRKSQIKRGNVEKMLTSLTDAQRTWLYAECGKLGVATLTEYFGELVRDAYEESLPK